MISKVEAFKTSDGKVFENESDAITQNQRIKDEKEFYEALTRRDVNTAHEIYLRRLAAFFPDNAYGVLDRPFSGLTGRVLSDCSHLLYCFYNELKKYLKPTN